MDIFDKHVGKEQAYDLITKVAGNVSVESSEGHFGPKNAVSADSSS
jgi:hypothetical protein